MASDGGLQAALDAADAAAAEVREAESQLADVYAALQAVLADSADDDAHTGLASLVDAQGQLAEALAAISAGFDLLKEYSDYIGQSEGPAPEPAAGTGTTEVSGTGQGPASSAGTSNAPVPLPDFNPQRAHPQAREAIRRVGWPRNACGDIAARGLLYDRTGRPLLGGKTLPASSSGPGSDTSDLKEPWRSDDRYTTRFHVEGHTVAFMRRNGITEAVLYLNIAPCGNRGPVEPDPIRCEANLAAHLPEGSVLYVHSVHENGTTRSKAYTGTGEALQ